MPSRLFSAGFELQRLESRFFLSATTSASPDAIAPSMPVAEISAAIESPLVPADILTKAMRQTLLDRWHGPNKASLQQKLNANQLGAFDAALLEYMRNRDGDDFMWNQENVPDIIDFINDNLDTSLMIQHGEDLVDHVFPEQGNSDTYTVQLPAGTIDWGHTPASITNPEFIQGMNRHEFWVDLAQAYRYTRNVKYVNELIAQLTSWSQQNPALANPNDWPKLAPRWNLLDASVRASSWSWTYQMVLGGSGWTAQANTLFLAKLYEQGDFLRRVTPFAVNGNRALVHASGLLQIAQVMPEFTTSPEWETYARKLLFSAMDAELYPDGGHIEQSPNYAINVINDLLEAFWLDRLKGDESKWGAERITRLHNAMEAHIQLLTPDAAMAALSDTYRTTSAQMFTKGRIILETDAWPFALPRLRDVWMFGPDAMEPLLDEEVAPRLSDRGKTFGMPDEGYYVMRSSAGTSARQITFDAGPTGGIHGHYDLLNFELFGYGKPLIADPGLYKYDESTNRAYVVSTRAHNTINVDGDSHDELEGIDNASIVVDQWTSEADHAQVAAHHFGYQTKAGSPIVGRNIWFDYDGIALIVDWGQASTTHAYQVSFNLPGTADTVSGVESDGSFRTRYSSGNVKVAPLLRSGQVVARNAPTFISNQPPPDESDPAYRFTITASGTFQVFATLVTTYSGTTAPNVKAEWVTTNPQPGQPIVLRLTKNGVSRDITFAAPVQRPTKYLGSEGGSSNDMAFDGDKLHLAFFDRDTRSLKYTGRAKDGTWTLLQTIDPNMDAGAYVSLAVDSKGLPGVAYYDGHRGDLKFARMQSTGGWSVQTVDSVGEVGLYPSLVFSRTNDPIITYYRKTSGDLRMATTVPGGWQISSVDTTGDVGRFSSLQLDPNFPTVSQISIAYEDTSNGSFKYAVQSGGGWKTMSIDNTTTEGGGYTSLAFEPFRSGDGTFHPAVSYYDAAEGALKYATFDGAAFHPQVVASEGNVGLYTNLVYDAANRANIFFFNKSANRGYRAIPAGGGVWHYELLGPGGREISVARHRTGALAYSTLDENLPLLEVGILVS